MKLYCLHVSLRKSPFMCALNVYLSLSTAHIKFNYNLKNFEKLNLHFFIKTLPYFFKIFR
jgi:hypothetical protein